MVGEPDDIEVVDFTFDQSNLSHLARHGVTAVDAYEVLYGAPRFFRNLPGRVGTHVMIGEGGRGRFFYIVLSPTDDALIWRPITGWQLGRSRAVRLYNSGQA